jgi:hypothetical protein
MCGDPATAKGDASLLRLSFRSVRSLKIDNPNGQLSGVSVALYHCRDTDADCAKRPGAGIHLRTVVLEDIHDRPGVCATPTEFNYAATIPNYAYFLVTNIVITKLPDMFHNPTVTCQ